MKLNKYIIIFAAALANVGLAENYVPDYAPEKTEVNLRDRTTTAKPTTLNTKTTDGNAKMVADELAYDDELKTRDEPTEITNRIRTELINDRSLSKYAKNITILVSGYEISFKGTIKAESERKKILSTAAQVAPNYEIQDSLRISK